ncbi:LD-carboxypeptidase [soil metagenome]
MQRPRALRPGDKVAVIAPASAFARDAFDAGLEELRGLGFEPVYEASVFEHQSGYLAGSAETRAAAFRKAWTDPGIAALVAVRGGYGSVQLLPLLDTLPAHLPPKAFIGYSDNTSLLSWLTLGRRIVAFHGPMIEGRFARGPAAYDRDTFHRCLCRTEPVGPITSPQLEVLRPGEASGVLLGGTLTQLAASLGTPYAFAPPDGCVLFLEDVAERPYRIDRLFTQLRLAGVVARASALVFGEMTRCAEPGGTPAIKDVVLELTRDFRGPVLFGLPSGHTTAATLTLPLGTRATIASGTPPAIIIDEAAVV